MTKTAFLLLTSFAIASAADTGSIDLVQLAASNKIELFNRKLVQTPGVVCLSAAEDDGLGWLSGMTFSAGTINVEIRGRNLAGQSFVGIAFHGADDHQFDAVYLRPFNFQSSDASHRMHAIQYVSLPKYDWSNLRQQFPGKYENALIPAPNPDSWVNLKLVVTDAKVSAFVNGASTPALDVRLLSPVRGRKVGLWVGNGSDGCFRSVSIGR